MRMTELSKPQSLEQNVERNRPIQKSPITLNLGAKKLEM
jgi:hypothetical protein